MSNQQIFQYCAKEFVRCGQYDYAAKHYELARDVASNNRHKMILDKLAKRYSRMAQRLG